MRPCYQRRSAQDDIDANNADRQCFPKMLQFDRPLTRSFRDLVNRIGAELQNDRRSHPTIILCPEESSILYHTDSGKQIPQ